MDPVFVSMWHDAYRNMNWVDVPDKGLYLIDYCDCDLALCHTHYVVPMSVLGPVSLERSDVLAMLDRAIRHCDRVIDNCETQPKQYGAFQSLIGEHTRVKDAVGSWKTSLVLERLRRKIAARVIQRTFRASMSNPVYHMCRDRLLREFKDLAIGT
jgi:hypothetical protein